jgi:hypothetical protein
VQVAVVNREFARELFHSDEVIGHYFKNESGRSIQIVGIVADGKHLRLNEDTEPAVFFPFSQSPDTNTSLIVRTRPDPSGAVTKEMTASIRKVISDLDSAVPIQQSGAWSDQLGLVLFPSRAANFAPGFFGASGLLLSVTGTFGLASLRGWQTSPRTEHPGRARRPRETNSVGGVRPDADPACQRLSNRDPARFCRQPGAISNRLPSVGAGPDRVRSGWIDRAINRLAFGGRAGATRAATRSRTAASRRVTLGIVYRVGSDRPDDGKTSQGHVLNLQHTKKEVLKMKI